MFATPGLSLGGGVAPSKVEGTRGEEKQKHPLQQIPCPGKNRPLSGGFLLRGFCIPRKGGGEPLERKCKKEESAQRGVWGEVPETTHALKERDSRKDRVGKGGGGGSREGQKKRSSLREKSRRTSRTATYSCGDVFASDAGGAGDTCLLLLSLASLGAWNARGAGIEPRPRRPAHPHQPNVYHEPKWLR